MAAKAGASKGSSSAVSAMECNVRLPLPDAASASVLWTVLKTDPAIANTVKQVYWCSDDATRRTVGITIQATSKRDLRSAVGAVLEQAKLVVRTLRVYPPAEDAAASVAAQGETSTV